MIQTVHTRRKTARERLADPSTASVTVPASLLDAFKIFLGIDPGDTTSDPELEAALQQAIAVIEGWLDRIIIKRPVDEYFAHHIGTVQLHEFPVDLTAPLNVFKDGVLDENYKPWLTRKQICNLSRTGNAYDTPVDWRPYAQVTITYTAGYDPLPSDLTNAIIWTANGFYTSTGTGTVPGGSSGDVKSMSLYDVGSISYDVGGSSSGSSYMGANTTGPIPDSAAQILTRYRRMFA